MVTQIVKKQTEITATAVYRVAEKVTGKVFYAVESDTHPGSYYKVTRTGWDKVKQQHILHCSCPATTQDCKHNRAVLIVLDVKAEEKQQVTTPVAEVLAQAQSEMVQFEQAMDAQYSHDPRVEAETAASYVRMFYGAY
jgi:hypothetical protein